MSRSDSFRGFSEGDHGDMMESATVNAPQSSRYFELSAKPRSRASGRTRFQTLLIPISGLAFSSCIILFCAFPISLLIVLDDGGRPTGTAPSMANRRTRRRMDRTQRRRPGRREQPGRPRRYFLISIPRNALHLDDYSHCWDIQCHQRHR